MGQSLSCVFLPLFNGGLKSPDKFDSYRAIVGAYSLFGGGEVGARSLMQFGFNAGVSITHCSWLVDEASTFFMTRGTAVDTVGAVIIVSL